MNKKEFIRKVSRTSGFNLKQTEEFLDGLEKAVKELIEEKIESFKFAGFIFEIKEIPERDIINNLTGEEIHKNKTIKIKVKPSYTLKAFIENLFN